MSDEPKPTASQASIRDEESPPIVESSNEKSITEHDTKLGSSDGEAIPATTQNGLAVPEQLRGLSEQELQALEKRLRRKIDLRMMPMIVLMYILNYIDRNNIAAAGVAGMKDDLKLHGSQFQTSVSILFVGYVLMQIPSNMLLNKTGRPAIYLPSVMIIWGVISAATASIHNFAGLLSVRFFLGFVEAAYYPGCLYYLSCWYTRKEISLRTTILYLGALISGAFSGLIAAGITANMDGARNLRAWRWLFLIEGVITIAVAILAYFVLPNFPRTTKWLREDEKAMAIWRLEKDVGEDDWKGVKEQMSMEGFKLAVEDVKTWVLLFLGFCIVSAGSITNFFPTVVKTLNYGTVETLLLTAPPYVLACFTTCLNAWHADKTGERFWHIVGPLCVGAAAFVIGAATTNTAARYVSMMIMLPGIYGGYTISLSWISSTLPRPATKRTVALALINAISNCASIYSSYMYQDFMKPRFMVAFIHNCVVCVLAIVAAVVLRIILQRLNKKLERGEEVKGAVNGVPGEASRHGFRFLI